MAAGGTRSLQPRRYPETFLADILKAGGHLNNAKFARMVAEKSSQAVLNLETHDYLLDWKDEKTFRTLNHGEGHTWPRGYLDRREALGICHALSRALMRNEITLFPETIVSKLLEMVGPWEQKR
jgi:succinate dehydrogenase/fumarate reductase flavoprotein subunit